MMKSLEDMVVARDGKSARGEMRMRLGTEPVLEVTVKMFTREGKRTHAKPRLHASLSLSSLHSTSDDPWIAALLHPQLR